MHPHAPSCTFLEACATHAPTANRPALTRPPCAGASRPCCYRCRRCRRRPRCALSLLSLPRFAATPSLPSVRLSRRLRHRRRQGRHGALCHVVCSGWQHVSAYAMRYLVVLGLRPLLHAPPETAAGRGGPGWPCPAAPSWPSGRRPSGTYRCFPPMCVSTRITWTPSFTPVCPSLWSCPALGVTKISLSRHVHHQRYNPGRVGLRASRD